MTEWRLFEAGTVPAYTTKEFFESHPWIPPGHQAGHAQRTAMAAEQARDWIDTYGVWELVDLGAGDGSLLSAIDRPHVRMWGYDAGLGNLDRARQRGIDVRRGDISDPASLELAEMAMCCEVLEHMLDPHQWLASLPDKVEILLATSPSAETGDWFYEHHAFAWDMAGYQYLLGSAGWTVQVHVECEAGENTHGGVTAPQRFQCAVATR